MRSSYKLVVLALFFVNIVQAVQEAPAEKPSMLKNFSSTLPKIGVPDAISFFAAGGATVGTYRLARAWPSIARVVIAGEAGVAAGLVAEGLIILYGIVCAAGSRGTYHVDENGGPERSKWRVGAGTAGGLAIALKCIK